MDLSDLIFVGVGGHVVALSKLDGSTVWKTKLSGWSNFVTVLVEGGRVYAHNHGEAFCLDAMTGEKLWSNGLKGLGYEVAVLASEGISAPPIASVFHHKQSSHSGKTAGTN